MAPRRRPHRDIAHNTCDADAPRFSPDFVPVCECPAIFPLEVFITVLDQIILHPEHSSSNILRAELLRDLPLDDAVHISELHVCKRLERRLKASHPHDGDLDQFCTFYRGDAEALVLLEPSIPPDSGWTMPFYHPDVSGIAFRYMPAVDQGSVLRIDMRPLPGESIERYEGTSRIYRTALALLTSVRKRGEGILAGYTKRVHHDRLVDRDKLQDKRLELKPRYAWALKEWRESTPPEKHVFEDIAIAAFLIVLWQDMYKETDGHPPHFVDVGAGNGFLTYILAQEGFPGYGIDLRARKSWTLWRERSQRHTELMAQSLDLPCLVLCESPFDFRDAFLIGNHADELTPWIPLLATAHRCSGFINIACCAHDLWRPFSATSHCIPSVLWPSTEDRQAYESVTRERGGRYAAFVDRIAELTLDCGWLAEREMLRTSSTRNAAIVGRKRFQDREHVMSRILQLAEEARAAGWRAREKDGKDH